MCSNFGYSFIRLQKHLAFNVLECRSVINYFKHSIHEICFSLFLLATSVNLWHLVMLVGKLLHNFHSNKKSAVSGIKFLFLHATCAFAYAQPVSYYSLLHNLFIYLTKSVVSDMKFVFLYLHLYFCKLVHSLMLRV